MKVMQMENIDWDYWLDLIYVDEWKACGLSLGINPKNIKRDFLHYKNLIPTFYYHIKDASPEVINQFTNRLDIIQDNKYLNHFASGDTEVHLEKFVKWALTKKSFKNMPRELLLFVEPENQQVKIYPPSVWHSLCDKYAEEELNQNLELLQEEVAKKIHDRFKIEGILTRTGCPPTVKTIIRRLSDWEFNIKRLDIQKKKNS
jgi:hypothetical protein